MNSTAKVSLKTFSDGYSLVVDGEESEPVSYGEMLEMVTGDGRRFIAMVEAQGNDVESIPEFWAYEALPVVDVPILEEEEEEEGDDEDTGDESDEVDGEDEEEEVDDGVKADAD
jgi:hypothetical protein